MRCRAPVEVQETQCRAQRRERHCRHEIVRFLLVQIESHEGNRAEYHRVDRARQAVDAVNEIHAVDRHQHPQHRQGNAFEPPEFIRRAQAGYFDKDDAVSEVDKGGDDDELDRQFDARPDLARVVHQSQHGRGKRGAGNERETRGVAGVNVILEKDKKRRRDQRESGQNAETAEVGCRADVNLSMRGMIHDTHVARQGNQNPHQPR